jgi:hypothetical protein
MHSSDSHELEINFDGDEPNTARQREGGVLVPAGSKLPHSFQVPTSKLLDVIVALSPRGRGLEGKQRKKFRQALNQRLYTKTRPGFYLEVGEVLHIAYAGQPGGAGTQHHWRIFCNDQLKHQIELLITGTALTTPQPGADEGSFNGTGATGNYCREWGGLYLRSEAEVRFNLHKRLKD